MYYSGKEIAIAAAISVNLQFMQDIRRHHLSIHPCGFNGTNRYDLTSFAVAVTTGELRKFDLSLAAIGRLLNLINIGDLSHRTEQLELCEIDDLIILIPQRNDYDDAFPTTVTSWDEMRHFGRDENINFLPIAIGDLLRAKIKGEW